jgi:hypothetical protein
MTREGCQQTPTARLNIHLIYQWGNKESLKNIMPAPSHDPTFESASPLIAGSAAPVSCQNG